MTTTVVRGVEDCGRQPHKNHMGQVCVSGSSNYNQGREGGMEKFCQVSHAHFPSSDSLLNKVWERR